MKSDRVWMNLFWLVRIPVSLALDEHAKQYVLALFPGWSPRLQQFHMYSLRSFLYKFCLQSKYLYFDQSYTKSMHFHNVRSKKEQKEYKEFEQLFSVSVHCNQAHRAGNS